MNKKGISPLIATVMLIGAVVALSVMIMMFGKEFVEKSTQRVDVESEEKTVCVGKVAFDILQACYLNNVTLKVIIANQGDKDIRKFNMRFYENKDVAYSVEIDSIARSGATQTFDIPVTSDVIREIELFPSVRHRFQTLTCAITKDTYGDKFDDILSPCMS